MRSPFYFLLISIFLACLSACRVQNNPPELLKVSPNTAYVDREVALSGYQFGSEPVVTFGEAASLVTARILSSDDNNIRVSVPFAPPGPTQIRVRNDQGVSDPLPFTVQQPAPALSAVTPANGLPGTTVVLTGNYLNQLLSIKFSDADAVIRDSTAQKLTVVVPENLPRGPLSIVVETKGGQLLIPFIVADTPQITSISPRSVRPGGELLIQGKNLTDGIVRINGLLVFPTNTTVKDNEIRATVPANATSGVVTVTVFERLIATSADSVKIVQQPSVANLSLRDGIAGDKIILNGLNLRDVTSVTFGTTAAAFRVLSDSQIETTVPTLPAPVQLAVSVGSVGGTFTATDPFFYYVAPGAITFSPTRALRNAQIIITGQNLHRITEVKVSGFTEPIIDRIEGSQLRVSVPANALTGAVTVTNRAGSSTAARQLVVIQPPVVTEIIPTKARPGERVVLKGNFLLNARILFTGTAVAAADGGRTEDNERWVLVPADAQSGVIRLTNEVGDAVTTDAFTVLRLAVIAGFAPQSAVVGADVTITGQHMSSVKEVRFNGGASLPAPFRLSGNALIVTVPGSATTGQICLTTDAGVSCTTGNFTVVR
ncbi:IPT/TIG domain-containing protein [Spirosoma montaniterrae]|uniref:Cell shape determination protein CcmA n=1 Tax=Spirosoma montaniterrae TaxID=1178516 RepID=A0A1P9WWY4_9BACT|nr:IPT/TIG domain-containing protein [Spirosoma montaniterrae]AQG79895.1 cell shape determination protein CcmA [Spirosoma montaniterrae]